MIPLKRTDSNSSAPICRVCYEGENEGRLISPCQCAGSIQFIHIHCLEYSANITNNLYCDICKTRYPLVSKNESLLEWCRNTDALLSTFQKVCDSFLHIIFMMILYYLSIFLFYNIFRINNYVVVNISRSLEEAKIFTIWMIAVIFCVLIIIFCMNVIYGYIPFLTEALVFFTCLVSLYLSSKSIKLITYGIEGIEK
ncbi:E3 ubiquitin-protein ligase MARCH1-like [Nylanderia fulva]|uniref:E3 ubiquitin-protein ligase MARCH1-like n=1 Tax=Nylanderia fulva TaxID=613905 RepID=UPI0010FADF8A|nr:E3 ubiquitin-protein ligase MARCH1-like [Nylanderia fulva]